MQQLADEREWLLFRGAEVTAVVECVGADFRDSALGEESAGKNSVQYPLPQVQFYHKPKIIGVQLIHCWEGASEAPPVLGRAPGGAPSGRAPGGAPSGTHRREECGREVAHLANGRGG